MPVKTELISKAKKSIVVCDSLRLLSHVREAQHTNILMENKGSKCEKIDKLEFTGKVTDPSNVGLVLFAASVNGNFRDQMIQNVYRMNHTINKESHSISFFNAGQFDRNQIDQDVFKAENLIQQKDIADNIKHWIKAASENMISVPEENVKKVLDVGCGYGYSTS